MKVNKYTKVCLLIFVLVTLVSASLLTWYVVFDDNSTNEGGAPGDTPKESNNLLYHETEDNDIYYYDENLTFKIEYFPNGEDDFYEHLDELYDYFFERVFMTHELSSLEKIIIKEGDGSRTLAAWDTSNTIYLYWNNMETHFGKFDIEIWGPSLAHEYYHHETINIFYDIGSSGISVNTELTNQYYGSEYTNWESKSDAEKVRVAYNSGQNGWEDDITINPITISGADNSCNNSGIKLPEEFIEYMLIPPERYVRDLIIMTLDFDGKCASNYDLHFNTSFNNHYDQNFYTKGDVEEIMNFIVKAAEHEQQIEMINVGTGTYSDDDLNRDLAKENDSIYDSSYLYGVTDTEYEYIVFEDTTTNTQLEKELDYYTNAFFLNEWNNFDSKEIINYGWKIDIKFNDLSAGSYEIYFLDNNNQIKINDVDENVLNSLKVQEIDGMNWSWNFYLDSTETSLYLDVINYDGI